MGKLKVYTATNGCDSAMGDRHLIEASYVSRGFEVTDKLEEADEIFLGGCGFTEFAQGKFLELYNKIAGARKPGSKFIVSGCVPGQDPELRKYTPNADEFLPIKNLPLLGKILGLEGIENEVPKYRDGDKFHVKIENGCCGSCTFCTIPNGRGKLRSYPISSIIEASKEFIQEGGSVINLDGEDVGAYGLDIGTNINELFRAFQKARGNSKTMLKLYALNPWYFSWNKKLADGMIEGMKEGLIVPDFGLPLQSGSNKILKAMRRAYTAQEWESIVEYFENRVPGIKIATDVIIGFPGETEEDFRDTFSMLERHNNSYYGVWEYSDMKMTQAINLGGKISHETKRERTEIIAALIISKEMKKRGCRSPAELYKNLKEKGEYIPMSTNDLNLFEGGDI